jgi:hypothetical protein
VGKTVVFKVPTAEQYKEALVAIESEMTTRQRRMLERHYRAHNRTATFTELARAAEYESNGPANSQYGKLGKLLGDKIKMTFVTYQHGSEDRDFFCSAIGSLSHFKEEATGDAQMIMHHELAKALDQLGWFRN